MFILIALIIGLLSTFVMTVFVQLLGYRQRKSIPWLLGTFINTRLKPVETASQTQLLAWGNITHYLTGIGFGAVYLFLWYQGWLVHSYTTVFVFGTIAGLLAVTVWYLTLNNHPLKTFISYPAFLSSIFVSHLVFAFSMAGLMDLCMIFFLSTEHFSWMYT